MLFPNKQISTPYTSDSGLKGSHRGTFQEWIGREVPGGVWGSLTRRLQHPTLRDMKLHRLRRTHSLQQAIIAGVVVVVALAIAVPTASRPFRALASPRRQAAGEHAHARRARRRPPLRRIEDLAVEFRGRDRRAGHGACAVSRSVASVGFGGLRRRVGAVWEARLGVGRRLQAVVLVEDAVQEQVFALLGRGPEGGCGRGEG